MEKELTKDEILKRYLNIAYFGDQVYGVEAASRYYFSKAAKDLTLPRPPCSPAWCSPRHVDPVHNPDKAKERRDVVLDRMRDLGMITGKEYTQRGHPDQVTKVTPAPAAVPRRLQRRYFCDYV